MNRKPFTLRGEAFLDKFISHFLASATPLSIIESKYEVKNGWKERRKRIKKKRKKFQKTFDFLKIK